MAHLSCYRFTNLPPEIINIVERDIEVFHAENDTSQLIDNVVNKDIRNSKNSWIPDSHWIAGWLWYYVQKINYENFKYDIIDIDAGTLQYTHYGVGEFYNWHQDGDIDTCHIPQTKVASKNNISKDQIILQGELVRKLSFSLQLSDPEDYEGGELEFLDNQGEPFFAPKQKGTIVVFDSRVKHRVREVTNGLRKSIVGWVVGPRWK